MPPVHEVRIKMFFTDTMWPGELASADYYVSSDFADDFCIMGFRILSDLVGIERTDYI